ncbi:MAG: HMA2 domain-containing protein [Syntrophobacteraceae bacterium]|jgi:copper chaperone CopZ
MSYYCHSTPGRLRIKTPIVKQNPVEVEKVRGMLESLSGVDAVSINALTGSITINYSDCETDSESILSILEEKGYYRISSLEDQEHPIETAVSKVGTTVGKVLVGAFVEKAFEGSMLSFLALLV